MTSSLDAAYLSAVLLAGALMREQHPKGKDAMALKDAIAKALTHPDTMKDTLFAKAWSQRKDFMKIKLAGETGELISKHASILTETNINTL
ncbi:MAG: hypothetical protein WAZ18_07100 [Alphaproteobacteria bacterium]